MNIKKNFTLILGISIPIAMILFVAAMIYLPGLFIEPEYNFLYVTGDDYYERQSYGVQNGKLVKSKVEQPANQTNYTPGETKLYIHDVASNQSQEVTYVEARSLNLDSSTKSPDGFEIVHGGNSDGFFFFDVHSSSDYNSLYISGHNVSKKLELRLSDGSYYNDFRFLGWID